MGRLLAGLLIVGSVYAGEPDVAGEPDFKGIVRDSVATVDANRDAWAYRIEIKDSESTRVIEHDPSLRPSRSWRLVSVDGSPPSDRQLREHRERWAEDDTSSMGNEMRKEYSLGDIIDMNSLAPLGETERHYVISFQPVIKDLGEESGKLKGKLFIDKQTQTLDFLNITNESSLSPAFSVSIDDFSLYFSFGLVEGTLFPREVKTDIEGTALFFKSFEQRSSQKYSDFRYVGDE